MVDVVMCLIHSTIDVSQTVDYWRSREMTKRRPMLVSESLPGLAWQDHPCRGVVLAIALLWQPRVKS